MGEFNVPVDIGNRALQRVGSGLISTTLGFAEISTRASAVSNCYGKLRQAELERNVWTFATRRQPLRPIDLDTMLAAPTLWTSAATYFVGSLVSDANGTIWESKIASNTGNTPGQLFAAWDVYSGPLTADAYDPTQTYFAGELVYTAPGDGTYAVFRSLVSGNGLDPSLPNQWSSGATYSQNNVVQSFPAWSSGTTYTPGQTVTYTDGNTYSSLTSGNLDNIPANTIGTKWALVPVLVLSPVTPPPAVGQPQTTLPQQSPVIEWVAGTVYSIGSFVMFDGAEWVSLVNNNTGNLPNASGSSSWAQVTGGTLWMSRINLNTGNVPSSTPENWSSSTTYTTGQTVAATDGYNYAATSAAGNLNKNPAGNAEPTYWTAVGLTAWTTSFTQGGGNQQWTQIGGAAFPNGVGLTPLNIIYPLGSGPSSQGETRNVFRLPANFLREAPQDPKAGSVSYLGAPSGQTYNDWNYQDDYIISRQWNVILYRFVADVQDVRSFDAMFCEGLSCRIGLEVCEPLTQSVAKKQGIERDYAVFMGEARTRGGIEQGPTEPPEDDFITARQ